MKEKLTATLLILFLMAGCRPAMRNTRNLSPETVRIVTTAPALTEMVCAVGASGCLAGRTDVCDYPPEITAQVPAIGRFALPNTEQVIARRPTHLIESFLVNPAQKKTLQSFNICVEHIECNRIADIPVALRRIGEIAGHRSEADMLASRIETGITAIRRAGISATGERPRTLILLDHLSPVTCGTNTFISEMVSLAGADNIAVGLQKEYDTVSLEWIMERKPDLILCFYALEESPAKHFGSRAGWRNIAAVRNGRVVVPEHRDLICRPGPRVLEGIEVLRRCIEKTLGESVTNDKT